MARKAREITQRHLEYIACAISRLEVAREFLRLAGGFYAKGFSCGIDDPVAAGRCSSPRDCLGIRTSAFFAGP